MTEKAKKTAKVVHKAKAPKKSLPVAKEEEPKDDGKPWTTRTLAEQGPSLPIGTLDTTTGNLIKSFTIRPFKTKDEKTLGKLKKPHLTMAQYVSIVVATMCDEIGGVSMAEDIDLDVRVAQLGRMYMADIFYVYTWLRHQTMGSTLKLSFGCPTCAKSLPFSGDLGSVEVRSIENVEQLRSSYDMIEPFSVRGKLVKKVALSSPTWVTATAIGGQGQGGAKAMTVKNSVVGLNDDSAVIMLTDDEMDEMGKRDLEELVAVLDGNSLGPNMALEGTCAPTDCPMGGGKEFRVPIDWSYDSFFGASSK